MSITKMFTALFAGLIMCVGIALEAQPGYADVTFTCAKAPPSTAAGYASLLASVPTSQWGAADVALTVKVGTNVVWLWGDTLSQATSFNPYAGRFVRSSAIVQRGGCMHVSHSGAQLLPNDTDGSWYWINAAAATSSTSMRISAQHVVRTGSGAWDFAVVGVRTARAWVSSAGNVNFSYWESGTTPVTPQNLVVKDGGAYAPWSTTVSEVSTGQVLVSGLPGTVDHYSYAPFIHTELKLGNGQLLMTVCQNGTLTSYAGYRPLFFGVTL